jgi:hypothetical protein
MLDLHAAGAREPQEGLVPREVVSSSVPRALRLRRARAITRSSW